MENAFKQSNLIFIPAEKAVKRVVAGKIIVARKEKKLTQDVFKGKAPEVVVAAVDFDGLLKYGDSIDIRYTWASERWRGATWLEKVKGTSFEPLTKLDRI